MRLRSYVVDVRSAVTAYWWVPWIVLPLAPFGLGVFVVVEPLYGAGFAADLSSFYVLLAIPIAAVFVVGQLLWDRFSDDTDHRLE